MKLVIHKSIVINPIRTGGSGFSLRTPLCKIFRAPLKRYFWGFNFISLKGSHDIYRKSKEVFTGTNRVNIWMDLFVGLLPVNTHLFEGPLGSWQLGAVALVKFMVA